MNLFTKQKETHRLGKQTLAGDRRWGEQNSYGVWDGHVHTAIFIKDNQQGSTV